MNTINYSLPSLKLSGTLATKRHRNQAPFLTCSRASATSTMGNSEGNSEWKQGFRSHCTHSHGSKGQSPGSIGLLGLTNGPLLLQKKLAISFTSVKTTPEIRVDF